MKTHRNLGLHAPFGAWWNYKVSAETLTLLTSECPHDVQVRLTRVWTHHSRSYLVIVGRVWFLHDSTGYGRGELNPRNAYVYRFEGQVWKNSFIKKNIEFLDFEGYRNYPSNYYFSTILTQH